VAVQRLDRVLSSTGRWSRKEARELIRAGRVTVKEAVLTMPEAKVDPETDRIRVDGTAILWSRYTWVMLNKPAGFLSATEDGRGATVLDLLSPELKRKNLFPVGRLDKDTEGLLLLTDEGPLAHLLLAPKRHVDKVYFARVTGCPRPEDCAAFEAGIVLEDGTRFLGAKLEILRAGEESEVLVTLREGKFHQVKRMLARVGTPVLYLERIRMGPLSLDPALARGEYRLLDEKEVSLLHSLT